MTNGKSLLYNSSIKSIRLTSARITAFAAAGLFVSTVAAAVVSAVVLELFTIRRVDGGSLTTHFPGYVYANATVLKVLLFETAALFLSVIVLLFKRGVPDTIRIPRFGLTSIFAQPAALLISAFTVVAVQNFGTHITAENTSYISRLGVFVLLGAIAAGAVLGIIGFLKKEQPVAISSIGLLSNLLLLILFYYFQFYKLGFDQDNWAN